MQEFLSIFLIGVSLSMDTFSLSLGINSIMGKNKLIRFLPLLVGIFHFFMPLIGTALGFELLSIINVASNKFLGIILLILGIHLFIDSRKEEDIKIKMSIWGLLAFAFSVSIDSFSVGLCLSDITSNYLMASTIFAICSYTFTYLGLIVGKYSTKFLGYYANIIGVIILITMGIIHIID